jgi:cephalosporin hydroxylase
MNPVEAFEQRNRQMITHMWDDAALQACSRKWMDMANNYEYSYHFTWMGRPVIQYPQDLLAMQELIWRVRPDLVIETGVAHGGSLVFYASMLELIGRGRVVGIDIDIRAHNRQAIEAHPMFGRITMLQGSSVDACVVEQVHAIAQTAECVIVVLDSLHTHDHVARELELYAPLVTKGSYLVVFDTVIEDMPADAFPDRPWSRGNNPKTAVREFMKSNDAFVCDQDVEHKLLVTVAPGGYLRRIK